MQIEPSEQVLSRWPATLRSLTSQERERAEAFARPGDRDNFVAAHLLARERVADLTGDEPASVVLTQHCPRCGGPHGRPSVDGHPEICVSWSHSSGHVLAVADRRRVGVDLERLKPLDEALLRRFATAREASLVQLAADPGAAFLLLWVAKESLVKVGAVHLDDLATVDLPALLDGRTSPTRWGDHDVQAKVSGQFAVGVVRARTGAPTERSSAALSSSRSQERTGPS